MNKFKITDLFPIFNVNDDDNIDPNIIDLFTVDYVINKLENNKIFSACLYNAPHYKESIEEWENRYITPVKNNYHILGDDWVFEIFISPDCIKYIDQLKHPRVQFNVMKHTSTKTFPGMLWRYIPLSYENKIVIFTDLDTPHPPIIFREFMWAFHYGYQMIRYSCFRDIDDEKKFIYKAIQGMFMTYHTDKNIIRAMSKWMMEETKRVTNTIGNDKAKYIEYNGGKYRICGTESDSCYANDEMFLSCYVYHKLKDKSLTMFLDYIPLVWKDGKFIIADANFPKLPLNDVFKSDLDSINYPSVLYMNKHR
jgi:hypothetical protein